MKRVWNQVGLFVPCSEPAWGGSTCLTPPAGRTASTWTSFLSPAASVVFTVCFHWPQRNKREYVNIWIHMSANVFLTERGWGLGGGRWEVGDVSCIFQHVVLITSTEVCVTFFFLVTDTDGMKSGACKCIIYMITSIWQLRDPRSRCTQRTHWCVDALRRASRQPRVKSDMKGKDLLFYDICFILLSLLPGR